MATNNITILHGDNTVASRQERLQLISQLQKSGLQKNELLGDKITAPALELALLSQDLFTREFLVIDNLLGRLRSKEKDACIQIVLAHHQAKPLIFWDKKELTALMLKPFVGLADVKIYKERNSLYPFLDSLRPQNASQVLPLFHQALQDNDVFMLFGSLVRRVGDLIIGLDQPTLLKGSPWTVKQIRQQAQSWTLPQLEAFHSHLSEIDLAIKTGQTKLDLAAQLDICLLEL